VASLGHDANCLFVIALIHVGFVGNPAAAWRYRISFGCIFSVYTLWIASLGGGCSGRNSVGGFAVKIVSVFLLSTMGTRGMRHSFACLLYHPCNIAFLVTNTVVSLASYLFISSSLYTVMYPASAILGMLRSELLVMEGMMWISFAGWRMSKGSSLMVSAAVRVPFGSWKILSDVLPVGLNANLSSIAPMFDVAVLSATMDGMVPSSVPCLMFSLANLLMPTCLVEVCSLTWQSGGVVLVNM
jgi:hypothetical protein